MGSISTVELFHFNSPLELTTDSKIIETAVKKFSKYNVKLRLENASPVNTLISNIESAIQKAPEKTNVGNTRLMIRLPNQSGNVKIIVKLTPKG